MAETVLCTSVEHNDISNIRENKQINNLIEIKDEMNMSTHLINEELVQLVETKPYNFLHLNPENKHRPITNFYSIPLKFFVVLPKFVIDEYTIEADLTEKYLKNNHMNVIFLKIKKISDQKMYFLKISNAPKLKNSRCVYMQENEIYTMLDRDQPNNILWPIYHEEMNNISLSISDFYEYALCEYILLNKKLSEEFSKNIYAQICSAIKYFHDKNIMIGDIKPDNILINPLTQQIFLIDFETCCQLPECSTNMYYKFHCGSRNYYAPESYVDHLHGLESDVWASGIVLHAMLFGFPPTSEQHFKALYNNCKILKKDYKTLRYIIQNPDVTKECDDLLQNVLNGDILKRITITNALTHSWFAS
jgi:serine/threonine protein kinase